MKASRNQALLLSFFCQVFSSSMEESLARTRGRMLLSRSPLGCSDSDYLSHTQARLDSVRLESVQRA